MIVAQSRRSIACAQNNHCPRVSGPNAFVLWIPHSPPPDTGTILNSIMAFQCTRDGLYAMAHECPRLLHGVHFVEVGRVTRMSCGPAREGGSAGPWSKPGCRVWRYRSPRRSHARLEHLCLHGGGREAAHQPELDLRTAIEAAHVGDESVDQITKAARSGRTAVEAGQEILVIGYARPERRRTSADRGAIEGRTCVHARNYAHHEHKSRPKRRARMRGWLNRARSS